MSKKILMAVLLLLETGQAFAGFYCQNEDKTIKITAEHKEPNYNGPFETNGISVLTIIKSEETFFEGEVDLSMHYTRVGKSYYYDTPESSNFNFSVNQTTAVVSSPGGCLPHSRMTCDYEFKEVYVGYFNIDGEKNVILDCQYI